jgi:Tol biopolymer transport system component
MGETPFHLASLQAHDEIARLLAANGAHKKPPQFPVIRGEYIGQDRPGWKPQIFAPGLVSAYAPIHGCVTLTPDGKEIYWSVVDFQKRGSTIYCMKMVDGRWTKPEVPPFSSQFSDDVPFCAPGGEKLYFLSSRPLSAGAEPGDENIWVMERYGNGWGEPVAIKGAVNGMDLHWQFSVAGDGAIYFASSEGGGLGLNDIYRSGLRNGEYQAAENLGEAINSEVADFAPYISADESFLVFTSVNRPQGSGLYISYRKKDGAWTEAEYMGDTFGDGALLTTMSADGKYLFFTGRREGRKGVFWVDAALIDDWNPVKRKR